MSEDAAQYDTRRRPTAEEWLSMLDNWSEIRQERDFAVGFAEHNAIRSIEVISVIHVQHPRGAGIARSTHRIVDAYYLMDGTLLAEIDHFKGAVE